MADVIDFLERMDQDAAGIGVMGAASVAWDVAPGV